MLRYDYTLNGIDKKGSAEKDHDKVEIASLESNKGTWKRKRGRKRNVLAKQKYLKVFQRAITHISWWILNFHRDEGKGRKKAKRNVFEKKDCETLENSFLKYHQPKTDESHGNKLRIMMTMRRKITPVE